MKRLIKLNESGFIYKFEAPMNLIIMSENETKEIPLSQSEEAHRYSEYINGILNEINSKQKGFAFGIYDTDYYKDIVNDVTNIQCVIENNKLIITIYSKTDLEETKMMNRLNAVTSVVGSVFKDLSETAFEKTIDEYEKDGIQYFVYPKTDSVFYSSLKRLQ